MTYQKDTPIRNILKSDRPREKLIKYGPAKLSKSELLAVLLGSGNPGENVVALAKRVLSTVGSSQLPQTGFAELKKIVGLGEAKASAIVAAFELGQRLLKGKETKLLITPQDVYKELGYLKTLKKEHFVIVFLDSRQQIIKKELIAVGTVNESLVHPREVFEPAVRCLANGVIATHNHPSGDPNPSGDDIALTRKLQKAGEILSIKLLDHIIVGSKGYFSFKEQKLL